METDRKGVFKHFLIRFRASCGRGHLDDGRQGFIQPMDRMDRSGSRDAGGYEFDWKKSGRAKAHTRVTGERVSPKRFEGTFSWRASYHSASGRRITNCRTARIHFAAHR